MGDRRVANDLAADQVRLGIDVSQIPLYVSAPVADALELALTQLRENRWLYQNVEAHLRRWQGQRTGPLTDLLAALVGTV